MNAMDVASTVRAIGGTMFFDEISVALNQDTD
jgi:hypothetical protein